MNIEKLKQEIQSRNIILPIEKINKLKTRLKKYILQYYPETPILSKENIQYLDYTLDWTIKRAEQYLIPRKSEYTNNLVIGDGTWLGNSEQYFQAITIGINITNDENKILTIKDFINEYLEQIGIINNTRIFTQDKKHR